MLINQNDIIESGDTSKFLLEKLLHVLFYNSNQDNLTKQRSKLALVTKYHLYTIAII